jgi:hypothetical protein
MKIIFVLLIAVASLLLGISFTDGFSELENTYVNEKCGVSIQYPADWTVEESKYASDDVGKTIAHIQSEDNDIYLLDVSIQNLGLSKYSIEDIAEETGFETLLPDSELVHSEIGQINGFPSYQIIYTDVLDEGLKFYQSHFLIIAYDREYRLNFDESDKAEFDKYSSIVEEMANSIKITKPNFEGVNC